MDGQVMRRAIDFLRAENERSGSPYFGKVDLTRIAASGHSQGGGASITATVADARIIAAVPIQPGGGSGTLTKPTFFIAGADDTVVRPAGVRTAYNAARGPAAYGLAKGVTHTAPIREPQQIWGPATAWFKAQLEKDQEARAWFYGECEFCKDTDWTVERKMLP